jgi:hypothetical protein
VFRDGGVSPFFPDVTDGGDLDIVVSRAIPQIAAAHPARTDEAELDAVVGTRTSGLREDAAGNEKRNCRTCSG